MKTLHLICNAHLDPVWMWEKDEGVAEVLSTYRVAADFCDDYPDFIFNHNESVLYGWVEEHDPVLFARIQKLVAEGRWKIIGGFYLQPDCNLPWGEAMVRQALVGRKYFEEKFGETPRTAINFDSFGHSRGLVQILTQAGFDSYMVCRPTDTCPLPADDFLWQGYDGSQVAVHRGYNSYESHRGKADQKIQGYMDTYPDKQTGLVLWGIGNHGGGPSRIDYERIAALAQRVSGEVTMIQSHPEAYFDALRASESLPVVEKPLHYHSVGGYTSQVRIKQRYRLLENMLFKVEKMASAAALGGLCDYPEAELLAAQEDMLFNQFHDILPGTVIKSAEEAALRELDHGIEITERIKLRCFLAMLRGEERAKEGDIPIFVYNPHPVPVRTIIECEFNLPDQNTDSNAFAFPRVYRNGKAVPCQVEHEESNFNVDWRKRVVFQAELAPSAMNRFDCTLEWWDHEPERSLVERDGVIRFQTETLTVDINCATGAVDRYAVNGREYLSEGSFLPVVMQDDFNPWGGEKGFREECGRFTLMNPAEGTAYSGITSGVDIPSVRVIEDGEVRTVVEALLRYGNSFLCLRYFLPKTGSEMKVTARVNWNEPMKLLKLPVRTPFTGARYMGQVMYGRDELPGDGGEAISQRWSAVVDEGRDAAVTIVSGGTYGSDFLDGEARLTLLRSPGYSAGCSQFSRRKPEVMESDRCNSFIDMGMREFTFWLDAGSCTERMERIETESAVRNETPFALSCFPSGGEGAAKPAVVLDSDVVQLTAMKKSAYSDNYILRLFEPTGQARSCTVRLPVAGVEATVALGPFEIVTLEYDRAAGALRRVSLLEKPL